MDRQIGSIQKVDGPLVVAGGMSGTKMFELVRVGKDRLIGEIIRLELDMASVQVRTFFYTQRERVEYLNHHCVKKRYKHKYPLGTGQRLSVNQVISLELEGVVGIVCHRS